MYIGLKEGGQMGPGCFKYHDLFGRLI